MKLLSKHFLNFNSMLMLFIFCMAVSSCSSNNDRSKAENNVETAADPTIPVIVPGQSIGQIVLDSNAAYVYDILGKPDAGDAAMGKAIATWYSDAQVPGKGISIYTAQATETPPAFIKEIRVTDSKYQTREGVGPGSSLEEIKKAYQLIPGEGTQQGGDSIKVYSDQRGIAFEIDKNEKCIGILVYPRGDFNPDTYLKFQS